MENLSCKIKNLGCYTVEGCITEYYDMGYADHSSLPIELREDECGSFNIVGTKKYGDFHIRITKQPDGLYWLFVSPNCLKKVK